MSDEQGVVSLIREVDLHLQSVHTQSLDISFNELADMVSEGELDISPDYQRLFQWSEGAQSRFIESLLLEMPVPPIYMVEEEDNKKLLIDGLQRLSSYLHFRGLLDAPHILPEAIKLGEKLKLRDCDIIKELNGKTYDDLGLALQIKLKRSFVRVEVVRRGSNTKFKYHMFKRLNTGGEALTHQQLRNCTIRLLDPKFNDFIINLADQNKDFKNCISTISEEQIYGAYDKELILRFFALKNNREEFKHDVSDFLTEYMEKISDPESSISFDYDKERRIFNKTFEVLNATLEDSAFSRANKSGTDLVRAFGVYHFEAFTIGIQKIVNTFNINDIEAKSKLATVLKGVKLDSEFIKLTTGGGKNSPGPLGERIKFVEDRLTFKE